MTSVHRSLIKKLFSVTLACLSFVAMEKVARAIITVDNPDNHLVPVDDFTGVVSLQISGEHLCTGSLLDGGMHILTAAHCITGNLTGEPIDIDDIVVEFLLPEGLFNRTLNNVFISPDWSGEASIIPFIEGGDIAILEMTTQAPEQAEQYPIFRDMDEIGQIVEIIGYGNYGVGSTGEIVGTRGDKKIVGRNQFEAMLNDFEGILPVLDIASAGSQLMIDFDDGLPQHDTFGIFIGINDLGLGEQEVFGARGDSGSPAFIEGKIAGVLSLRAGARFIGSPPDINTFEDSSFGEVSGYSRVSEYAGFIDSVVATSVPEPSSVLGLLTISGIALGASKKKLRW